MINPNDLPNFEKGDRLLAKDLQRMRDAISQQMLPGTFVLPGMVLQRQQSNIGDVLSFTGRFGLCTSPADPDGDGEYVTLNGDLQPVDENGAIIEGDPAGYGLPFTNIQQNCGIPEGARILISVMTSEATDEESVFGHCLDPMDALSTLAGDANGGLLGGSGSKSATWSGITC